jgi:hypothetical protein
LQLGTMIITCLNKANAFRCVRDGASFKSMLWHVLGNDQFFFLHLFTLCCALFARPK